MDPFRLEAIYCNAELPRTEANDHRMANFFGWDELQEAIRLMEAAMEVLFPPATMIASFANVQERCRYLRAIARLKEIQALQVK